MILNSFPIKKSINSSGYLMLLLVFQGTFVHLALKKGREILAAGKALNRGALPVMILMTDGDYEVKIVTLTAYNFNIVIQHSQNSFRILKMLT